MAILNHPEARKALQGLPLSAQLQSLSPDQLRKASAGFASNGRSGYNDPEHMGQCLAAVERRAQGDFETYLQNTFAETWLIDGSDETTSDTPREPSGDIGENSGTTSDTQGEPSGMFVRTLRART